MRPRDADVVVTTGDDREWELALFGHPLAAADQQLAEVVAAQVVFTVQRPRLALQAEQAHRLRQTDAVRTAILAAVSHDLRTPLATIKASMSSLRDGSVSWSPEDRDELLAADRRCRRPAGLAAGQPARPQPAADRGAVGPAPDRCPWTRWSTGR